jgi:endonuclease III
VKETVKEKKQRIVDIVAVLQKEYPDARCSLNFSNPLELLIATILSAQCTDERVNIVTEALFKKHPTVEHFANADIAELDRLFTQPGFIVIRRETLKNAARLLSNGLTRRYPVPWKTLLH